MTDKWIISPPGGPAGPFWGVVSQSGKVIALQIVEKKHAQMLIDLGNAAQGDFDIIHKAGKQLRKIITDEIALRIIDEGSEDYIIRSVIQALFE